MHMAALIRNQYIDINNLYRPIVGMLDERGDAAGIEDIEEVDNMQIVNVVVHRVWLKVIEMGSVTLKQIFGTKISRLVQLSSRT